MNIDKGGFKTAARQRSRLTDQDLAALIGYESEKAKIEAAITEIGATDGEIAQELGLSRQRVSDILVSVRRKAGLVGAGQRALVAAWYQRKENHD